MLAGGIESMSRMPYLIDAEDARWGHKMGNFTLVDAMYRDGFTCSVCGMIMGETAELLAREYGITREESDALRARDRSTAPNARSLPDGSATRSRRCTFTRSPKGIRPADARRGRTSARRHDDREPARSCRSSSATSKDSPGIITAGSSSGITDGGAAVVLMSADRGEGATA